MAELMKNKQKSDGEIKTMRDELNTCKTQIL